MGYTHDAILTGWFLAEGRLHGNIQADSKKRWHDGHAIVTTRVQQIRLEEDGRRLAVTKNTVYLLA